MSSNCVTTEIKGEFEAFTHRIGYRYWGDPVLANLEYEQEKQLSDAAEEQARLMIAEDYICGELNECLVVDGKEVELRGWWNIIR
jgi:hypothetical protein